MIQAIHNICQSIQQNCNDKKVEIHLLFCIDNVSDKIVEHLESAYTGKARCTNCNIPATKLK